MADIEEVRKAVAKFKGPKSVCECGHTGDGVPSYHDGPVGHGYCTHDGCTCAKFTWKKYTTAFKKAMEKKDG